MPLAENFQPFRDTAAAEVRPAREHHACRFAAGMGIDDLDWLHFARKPACSC